VKRATPWAGCTRWLPTEARGAAVWRVSSVFGTRRRRRTDRQCASTSTSRQRPARRSSGLQWAATRSSLAPTSSSTRPPHDSQVRHVPLHRPSTYAQSCPENVEHAAKLGKLRHFFLLSLEITVLSLIQCPYMAPYFKPGYRTIWYFAGAAMSVAMPLFQSTVLLGEWSPRDIRPGACSVYLNIISTTRAGLL